MKTRLYLSAGCPYALLLLLVGGIFSYTSIVNLRIRKLNKKESMTKFVSRSLHVLIITFYLVLPSVCRHIFDTVTSRSFVSNDLDNISSNTYYLIGVYSALVKIIKISNIFSRHFLSFGQLQYHWWFLVSSCIFGNQCNQIGLRVLQKFLSFFGCTMTAL